MREEDLLKEAVERAIEGQIVNGARPRRESWAMPVPKCTAGRWRYSASKARASDEVSRSRSSSVSTVSSAPGAP
jgi:hypothetical protein